MCPRNYFDRFYRLQPTKSLRVSQCKLVQVYKKSPARLGTPEKQLVGSRDPACLSAGLWMGFYRGRPTYRAREDQI